MTTLRCCLPTNIHYLFTLLGLARTHYWVLREHIIGSCRAPTFKRRHQDQNSVTNIEKLSPTLSQQRRDVTNITSKADLNSESFHWLKIAI